MSESEFTAIAIVATFIGTFVVGALLYYFCFKKRGQRKQRFIKHDRIHKTPSTQTQHRPLVPAREPAREPTQTQHPVREPARVPIREPTARRESTYYEGNVDELYEHVSQTYSVAPSLKYVPIDRLSLRASSMDKTTPLFVQMSVAGGSYYAPIDAMDALRTDGPVFMRVYDDVKFEGGMAQVPDTGYHESSSDEVYGNAESIIRSLVIADEELSLGNVIGTGAFGDVLEAEWHASSQVVIKVAVKRLKVSEEMQQEKNVQAEFVKEMSTMAQLNHENIVRVLALTTGKVPLIVLEFISGGSLHDWLRKSTKMPPISVLLMMAHQTAIGMAYLAARNVIHRDVAARNVLIQCESSTRFVCKLTDFGLSRVFDNLTYQAKQSTPIPVRWTALESLFFLKFSEKSDVWGYGVLLWEILTCCRIFPYEEYHDDVELVREIEHGKRLPCPEGLPQDIYNIMLDCWQTEPSDRPSFNKIVQMLPPLIFEVTGDKGIYDSIPLAMDTQSVMPRQSYRVIDESVRELWRSSYSSVDKFRTSSVAQRSAYNTIGNLEGISTQRTSVSSRLSVSQPPMSSYSVQSNVHPSVSGDPAAAAIAAAARVAGLRAFTPQGVAYDLTTPGEGDAAPPTSASFASPKRDLYTAVRKESFAPSSSRPASVSSASAISMARIQENTEFEQVVSLIKEIPAESPEPNEKPNLVDKTINLQSLPDLDEEESANIDMWKSQVLDRAEAEQFLKDSEGSEGMYLIRNSKDSKMYVLSMIAPKGIQHYRIQKLDHSRVALLDNTNGDREFADIYTLVKFYKEYRPALLGGLASKLTMCITPPFGFN